MSSSAFWVPLRFSGFLCYRLRRSRLSHVVAEVGFRSWREASAFAGQCPGALVRRASPLRTFFVVIVPLRVGADPLAGGYVWSWSSAP